MRQEFESAAERPASESSKAELHRCKAAFYLFQCYLYEFGTVLNGFSACKWLLKATYSDGETDEDYLAQAWLWRISQALAIPIDLSETHITDLLRISLARGHRSCAEDLEELIHASPAEKKKVMATVLQQHMLLLRTLFGAVGIGYFLPKLMTKPFDLDDLTNLDQQIRKELGDKYNDCLRTTVDSSTPSGVPDSATSRHAEPEHSSVFDGIYVNI
jgi:hypothetical protein